MDDIGKLHIQHSSHICRKILDDARLEGEDNILDNIEDHMPDGYGYCEDCNRIDPDGSDYGYCPDCEEHYSDDDIEDIKEKAKNEEYDRIIGEIEAGEITDPKLLEAIRKWAKAKGGK